MRDYRIARQRHVGEMLDKLKDLNLIVRWKWGYDTQNSRAIYWVTLHDQREQALDTRMAEDVVQRLCDDNEIIWKPVPHPGGERLRDQVLKWIAEQEQNRQTGAER